MQRIEDQLQHGWKLGEKESGGQADVLRGLKGAGSQCHVRVCSLIWENDMMNPTLVSINVKISLPYYSLNGMV